MEKIGVEVEVVTENEDKRTTLNKVANEASNIKTKCTHPESSIVRPDEDIVFCKKCGKYLR